jgi:hypothetical protein
MEETTLIITFSDLPLLLALGYIWFVLYVAGHVLAACTAKPKPIQTEKNENESIV